MVAASAEDYYSDVRVLVQGRESFGKFSEEIARESVSKKGPIKIQVKNGRIWGLLNDFKGFVSLHFCKVHSLKANSLYSKLVSRKLLWNKDS